VSLFTRSTTVPDAPSPARTLAIVKTEIAATDSALHRVGHELAIMYRQHREDLPIANAFRLSTSRPLHPEIKAAVAKRRELLELWSRLLHEYSELLGDAR
jgi:hypothetical protein